MSGIIMSMLTLNDIFMTIFSISRSKTAVSEALVIRLHS